MTWRPFAVTGLVVVAMCGVGFSAPARASAPHRTTVSLALAGTAVAGTPARFSVRVRLRHARRVLRYSVRFGDDVTVKRSARPPSALRHTYARAGNYLVTLTVTDSTRRPATARLRVIVRAAAVPPIPEPTRPGGAAITIPAPSRTAPVVVTPGPTQQPAVDVAAPAVRVVAGGTQPITTAGVTLTGLAPLAASTPNGLTLLGPDGNGAIQVAAAISAAPQALTLTINATGCTASACDRRIVVHLPVTVAPIAAPHAALDDFVSPSPDRPTEPLDALPGAARLTDELLIALGTPDSPGSRAEADAAAAANGGVVSGGIDYLGVYELRWTSPQDLQARRDALLASADVSSVSDSTVRLGDATDTPSDWADDGPQATWPYTTVRAPQAWDLTHGSDVTVGIIDVGVPLDNHEDLSVRTLGGSPQDHATHVAGLACAKKNGIGIVGMAWGCPLVAAAGGKSETKWLKAAYDVAREPNVKVVNMSLGYNLRNPNDDRCATPAQQSALAAAAADMKPLWRQLFEGAGRGIVWTISAGNDCAGVAASGMGANADLANVITVAATNSDGTLASYSDFGPGVEVAAPGGVSVGNIGDGTVGIWSTTTKSCGLFGWSRCGTYAAQETTDLGKFPITGTSMAAPMVAGIAALVRSAHPGYGAVETAACITQTAGQTVGRATSRSRLPSMPSLMFPPHIDYAPADLPIVNAQAAVACHLLDSTSESGYLGRWQTGPWTLDIAEESLGQLGIVNQAPTAFYDGCNAPPGTKIFTGFQSDGAGQWNGSVLTRNASCSDAGFAPTAAMRLVRGYNGATTLVMAWATSSAGARPSIDADGNITSSTPYFLAIAVRGGALASRAAGRPAGMLPPGGAAAVPTPPG
jgi:PKD repeat protein